MAGRGGLEKLFILLTINHLFLLQFFKTRLFLCLVSLELFFFFFSKKKQADWLKKRKEGRGGVEKKPVGMGRLHCVALTG